ncbi:T9SS type A sorting domain-containing protein [Hymenobacter cellulosilyticus]|uniref:T9SS type A sorting domain-containing protein n=1 Tax=Hymenobacter cellulosilyticus TaxID=2932248 RepID=A0A8T9Q1X0_9BACT|nr:T9SS type A sorting domain-containing protein [Hymenobacter cellulosilyticus]UOQ71417.1 T9SS type A sorting domain-containing protein [Hymenobacter cellulosilyticus]
MLTRPIFSRLLLLLFLISSLSLQAQMTSPNWVSATDIGSNGKALTLGGPVAFDKQGNTYEAGSFNNSKRVGDTVLTSRGDLDIYLAKYSPAGKRLWLRQVGTPFMEYVKDVVLDQAGNAYVTGSFVSSIAVGNNLTLNGAASGEGRSFVIRYSSQGQPEWVQQSTTQARFDGIGIDAADNVYLTGTFLDSVTVGSSTITASPDDFVMFLAQLSATTGAVQWLIPVYHYPPQPYVFYYTYPQLAVAPDGAVYFLNTFYEPPVFPGGPTLTSRGESDVLIARYSARGTLEWVRQYGGPDRDWIEDGAVDAAGNLYVTGFITGAASFGPVASSGAGDADGYLAAYSPQGDVRWVQRAEGIGNGFWSGVCLDPTGNPYVTGGFAGTTKAGAFSLTSAGGLDVGVAAYSAQGAVRWMQRAGGPNDDFGTHLGVDAQGDAYVFARFQGACAFGPFTLTAPVTDDVYQNGLAHLSSTPVVASLPLAFYPNPASDQLHLPGLSAGTPVQLLDALGRVARTITVSAAAQVSVQGLLPGLYTLRATDAKGQSFAGKVVVE